MIQVTGPVAHASYVIAGSAHAGALRRRLEHDPSVTVFCESESLEALRMIQQHAPRVLLLDPALVRTARGAQIVARVKEYPYVDVRVLSQDSGNLPLLLSRHDLALHTASHPLDAFGTRAAHRFAMRSDVQVVVDGERGFLVDLSTAGAQVLTHTRVEPRQSVSVTLADDNEEREVHGLVAWSTVELARSAVSYRAGVSFVDADAGTIDAFCRRNTA
jgi:DNA-binding NarL/FixJ family response regulator